MSLQFLYYWIRWYNNVSCQIIYQHSPIELNYFDLAARFSYHSKT